MATTQPSPLPQKLGNQLPGSERPHAPDSKLIRPADHAEKIAVTLLLRFPPNCPPLPDLAHWQNTPLHKRRYLSPEEHVTRYGATKADLERVINYVETNGMSVLYHHAGRRTVCILGTVAQLNSAFGVKLCHYESSLPRAPIHGNGSPDRHTHYGFDGPVHLHDDISDIVTAVVGLDNRRVSAPAGRGSWELVTIPPPAGLSPTSLRTGAAGTGDPSAPGSPNAVGLDVTAVAQYYNIPNIGAKDQVVGIIAPQAPDNPGYGAAYLASDINAYVSSLDASYQTPPVLHDISVTVGTTTYANSSTYVNQINLTTNLNSDPYGSIIEITQDISTCCTVAQGANINVYFTEDSEQGWISYLGHVLVPPPGEKSPTVLSHSWVVVPRGWSDDGLGPLSNKASTGYIMDQLFQQLAARGVQMFAAQGDWGADDSVADGKLHVAYPGTDPWVTSCGGTVLNLATPVPLEWTWSDSFNTTSPFGPGSPPTDFGSTGGGASGLFSTPDYQTSAGITSIKDSGNDVITGKRFVPDVASMVGYSSKFRANTYTYNFTGTSCVAPFYAGVAAVLNQAFGIPLGFLNPTFYRLGTTAFNDIQIGNNDPGDTPDSKFFSAATGWDPVTGWGSIDGNKLVNGIANEMFTQQLYLQGDKLSFSLDEVKHASDWPTAFWVVVEGFTPNTVGTTSVPSVVGTGVFAASENLVEITVGPRKLEVSGFDATPQRILFPCSIHFNPAAIANQSQGGAFPAVGATANQVVVSASFLGLSNSIIFELTGGSDPYFLNINPSQNNVFYLSQDLRVFTISPPSTTSTPIPGGPQMNVADPRSFNAAAGYQYIQGLLDWFNTAYSDPSFTDPFESVLPDQTGDFSTDSSVTPFSVDPSNPGTAYLANYNFAIARVRLNGTPNLTTDSNVRVFFRLFLTQSNDTDYDPNGTYAANFDGQSNPISPLIGSGMTTIPFFATGNYQANTDYAANVDYSAKSVNNTPITIGNSGSVWQYFGCYLNIYPPENVIGTTPLQTLLPGTHHCLVAQISFDEAPIPTTMNGITISPENTDKLAQRNLQITHSDNPGPASTHRIPQTFDVRPSVFNDAAGNLNYPDELMIDWGNTPVGSSATIYWPAVNSVDVLSLAKAIYSTHQLSAADSSTIQCKVPDGITFVPIPTAESGENLAGLFTVDLPSGVVWGQEFHITVRRISSRVQEVIEQPSVSSIRAAGGRRDINWRYIVGTFEIRIPVIAGDEMLGPEENTLAIMKWRFQQMPRSNRWYPVMQRYISYIAGRVSGLGGNPGTIAPSPTGTVPIIKPIEYTGKVVGIIYDRFGDFDGFLLCTEWGKEEKFRSREQKTETLVRFAWERRVMVSVFAESVVGPLVPVSVILRRIGREEFVH